MPTLSEIQNLLASKNWSTRSNAIRELEQFSIKDSLSILDIAIKDKQKYVRQAAIELMIKLNEKACLHLLEFCLTDKHPYNRELAFRAICSLYDSSCFSLLEQAINRKGELMKTRMGMIWELRHVKDKAFVPIILQWIPKMPLESTNFYILLEVISVLPDPQFIPVILKLGQRIGKKDKTAKVRLATILGHLRAKEGLDYILEQVGYQFSANNYSDQACLDALVLMQEPTFLLEQLDHYKGRKHNILVEALGQLGYPKARPILEQKLAKKTEINACIALIKALKSLGYSTKDKREKFLLEIAENDWTSLKRGSILARELLKKATKSYDPKIAKAAIEILGKIGDETDVEYLSKQVNSVDYNTRIAAIVSLGKIGDSKAIPSLVQYINKSSKNDPPLGTAKEEAVRALGKIGDSKVIPFLIEILQNNPSMGSRSNESIHGKALMETLTLLYAEEAIPTIVQNLSHRNHIIRITALKSLQQFDWQPNHLQNKIRWLAAQEAWDDITKLGKIAVKPLLRITENDAIYGQISLMLALAKIGDPRAEDAILRWLFLPHYQIHDIEFIEELIPYFKPLFHEWTLDILLASSFIDQEITPQSSLSTYYSYSLETAIKATRKLKASHHPLAIKALQFLNNKKKVSLAGHRHEDWGDIESDFVDFDFEEQKHC